MDLIRWQLGIMDSLCPNNTYVKKSIFCYTELNNGFGDERADPILLHFYAITLSSN